jgi:hypothetical protein
MAWLKSILYTWFKIFGISSPEDIAAERAARNRSREAAERDEYKEN